MLKKAIAKLFVETKVQYEAMEKRTHYTIWVTGARKRGIYALPEYDPEHLKHWTDDLPEKKTREKQIIFIPYEDIINIWRDHNGGHSIKDEVLKRLENYIDPEDPADIADDLADAEKMELLFNMNNSFAILLNPKNQERINKFEYKKIKSEKQKSEKQAKEIGELIENNFKLF